ncbi:hypothetical protein, partial [Chryseobacterium sp. SIMBA_038]
PWSGVTNTDIQIFDSERIVLLLSSWQKTLGQLIDTTEHLVSRWQLDSNTLQMLPELDCLDQDFSKLPDLKGQEYFPALRRLNQETIDDVERN